jgi:hypothetical protein
MLIIITVPHSQPGTASFLEPTGLLMGTEKSMLAEHMVKAEDHRYSDSRTAELASITW